MVKHPALFLRTFYKTMITHFTYILYILICKLNKKENLKEQQGDKEKEKIKESNHRNSGISNAYGSHDRMWKSSK